MLWSTGTRSRKQAGTIHPRQRVVTPNTVNMGRGSTSTSTSHPSRPSSACLPSARHSRALQQAESPTLSHSPGRLTLKPRPQSQEFPSLLVSSSHFFTHHREAAPLTPLPLSFMLSLLDSTNSRTYHTPAYQKYPIYYASSLMRKCKRMLVYQTRLL